MTPTYAQLGESIEHLHFAPVRRNNYGANVVYVQQTPANRQLFQFQAWDMLADGLERRPVMPFGVSEPLQNQSGNTDRKTLEFSLGSTALREFLQLLEARIVDEGVAQCATWFKRADMTRDQVLGKFKPIVAFHPEGKFDPLMRTKVNTTGKYTVEVFLVQKDGERETYRRGTLADVGKFDQAVPVVDLVSLWFLGGEFGASLSTVRLLVYPQQTDAGFSFDFGAGAAPEPMDLDDGGGVREPPPVAPAAAAPAPAPSTAAEPPLPPPGAACDANTAAVLEAWLDAGDTREVEIPLRASATRVPQFVPA